jgi:predicted PolB exonuclease-like 3'-5' exonuclease
MHDRPIIAFDIETMPDPEMGRRALGIAGDDATVVHEMVRRRLEETSGTTKYPALPWHRVVCVCITVLDPATGAVEMRSLGGDTPTEQGALEGFFGLFRPGERGPRLVSWNGGGFDLPVMRYRAMKHGIVAPDLYRVDGDRRFSNYGNRYHDLHVDVMDVLSGYGASPRAGLGATCHALGLPSKQFLDGEVYEHLFAGELPRIIEYCKLDTLETLLVHLSLCVHSGSLDLPRFRACLDGIRASVAAQTWPGWADVGATLRTWPPWLPEASGPEQCEHHAARQSATNGAWA